MDFCTKCGKQIPDNAIFCPKCGYEIKYSEAKDSSTAEMKETLFKMEKEIEKAFTLVAKEIQIAFKIARENIKKSLSREPIICKNCGENNFAHSVFCSKCGRTLSQIQ